MSALTRGEKFSYGVGNVGLQGVGALVTFFLLFYYTDVVGVPAGTAASALLVAKIWDIVNDPLFGWVSDRTRSRFGRRRIYLIAGAVPLGVVTFALFSLPTGLSGAGAFVAVVASFLLFDTLFTLVNVPYSAMSAELTHDYDERTSLLTYSSIGAVVGFLLGGALAPGLAGAAPTAQQGFRMVGAGFGLLATLSVAFVAWRVRPVNAATPPAVTLPIGRAIRTALRNAPFVRLITAFALARFGFTMISTSLTYFVVRRLLEDEKRAGVILGVLMVTVAVFVPFWRRVADRSSKGQAYAAGLLVTAVGMAGVFGIGEGRFGQMLLLTPVIGLGISAHWVIPWAMLPDVVEYDQRETGERREGMFFGVYGLVDKIARTLGLVLVGWVLAAFGYQADGAVTETAVLGIRLVSGPIPALFLLAAVPLLLRYPVTRAAHAQVRRDLGELAEPGSTGEYSYWSARE